MKQLNYILYDALSDLLEDLKAKLPTENMDKTGLETAIKQLQDIIGKIK